MEFRPLVTKIPLWLILFFSAAPVYRRQGTVRRIPQLSPRPHIPKKPTPAASADKEKEEGEWRVVSEGRGKGHTARTLSQHDPKDNGTNSPIPFITSKGDAPASYAAIASDIQKKRAWLAKA